MVRGADDGDIAAAAGQDARPACGFVLFLTRGVALGWGFKGDGGRLPPPALRYWLSPLAAMPMSVMPALRETSITSIICCSFVLLSPMTMTSVSLVVFICVR